MRSSPYRVIWLTVLALFTTTAAQYGAMAMEEGMDPRYHLGRSQLLPRDNGVCPQSDMHTCLDVNNGTVCCSNNDFCYVDTSYVVSCCAIGSNCGYTACDTNHYQCSQTTTVSGTATTSASCCPRSCSSTSQYLCASSLGGQCCNFDSKCAPGGSCAATTTSSPTTATACATTQVTCASSLGGGCCGTSSTCTLLSSTNFYCFSGPNAAVRTGSNGQTFSSSLPSSSSSGGLSSGAKAGIGAGIGVGGALLIAGLIWFCIVQRRHARAMSEQQSQTQSQSQRQSRQKAPTASAPAMSQGSSAGRKSRPPPGRQMTQTSDYFGPDPVPGPFTEGEDGEISPDVSSPGYSRGVPSKPQSPGDITIPVEIDSTNTGQLPRARHELEDPKAGPTSFIAELP